MSPSSMDGERDREADAGGTRPKAAESECILSERDQLINGLIFVACWALVYLVAPVMYVGIVHAAICNAVANLPQAAYMWMMPAPVLVAWLFPSERFFKPLLVLSFFLLGAAGAVVAMMFQAASREWIAMAIISMKEISAAGESSSSPLPR